LVDFTRRYRFLAEWIFEDKMASAPGAYETAIASTSPFNSFPKFQLYIPIYASRIKIPKLLRRL